MGLYLVWLYNHPPLVIGLAAIGVGVEHAVVSAPGATLATGERWLVRGAVALYLLVIGVIHFTTVAVGSAVATTREARAHVAG